jgi:hypothetical protein
MASFNDATDDWVRRFHPSDRAIETYPGGAGMLDCPITVRVGDADTVLEEISTTLGRILPVAPQNRSA